MPKPAPKPSAHDLRGWVSWTRKAGAAILAAAVAASAALTGGCAAHRPALVADAPAAVTLYVVRRQWHIDIGFAVDDLQEPLAPVARQFPGARYVFFGFGDRHYLLAKKRDAPVLAAALWPGPGLILVTSLMGSPSQAFGGESVIELRLAADRVRAVQDFIGHSISRDAAGAVESDGEGPYPGSAYLAAVPRYSGLHTCITWAAEALRAGGIPVRSRLTVVAAQLWDQLRKILASAVQDPAGLALRAPSVAGRRIAVLANHRRPAALRYHHSGLGGRRRATAADAAGQEPGGEYGAH